MKDPKYKITFEQLSKALISLENVIDGTETGSEKVLRDSTIQRFEYTIELFWKALKQLLENNV